MLVIDAAAKVGERVEAMLANVEARSEPLLLVINKVDIAKKDDLLLLAARLSERLRPRAVFMVSATSGDGVADAQPRVLDLLRVPAELLAEPHRSGIHQVGATDLDNIPELE